MKDVDVIVVGGGIAGCLVAFELRSNGKSVLLFDSHTSPGSSSIAAGSINPITGRRFVKSWNIDELIKWANLLYTKLEDYYGERLFHKQKVVRGIKKVAMLNDWSVRLAEPSYSDYIGKESMACPIGIIDRYVQCVEINGGGRVDFQKVMSLVKGELDKMDALRSSTFDYSLLVHSDNEVLYEGISCGKVLFTEGSSVKENLLWNWLPFVPARGERLIIHSPDLKLDDTFNDGKLIIPMGSDHYWVGSNYDWDNLDPIATSKGLEELQQYLDDTLSVTYRVIDHAGHVRPATYDRRPFVGRHPEFQNYYILNGLGAKGASLAPYCTQALLGHILEGAFIEPEIDVSRANSKYTPIVL